MLSIGALWGYGGLLGVPCIGCLGIPCLVCVHGRVHGRDLYSYMVGSDRAAERYASLSWGALPPGDEAPPSPRAGVGVPHSAAVIRPIIAVFPHAIVVLPDRFLVGIDTFIILYYHSG